MRVGTGQIVLRRSNGHVGGTGITQVSVFGEETTGVDTRCQLMFRCDDPVVIGQMDLIVQMHQHRCLNSCCRQAEWDFALVILREIEDTIVAKDRRQISRVTNGGGGEVSIVMFAMLIVLGTAKTNGCRVNVPSTIDRSRSMGQQTIVQRCSFDVIATLPNLFSQIVQRETRSNGFRSTSIIAGTTHFGDFFDDLQQIWTRLFDTWSPTTRTIEFFQLRMQFGFRFVQLLDLQENVEWTSSEHR